MIGMSPEERAALIVGACSGPQDDAEWRRLLYRSIAYAIREAVESVYERGYTDAMKAIMKTPPQN